MSKINIIHKVDFSKFPTITDANVIHVLKMKNTIIPLFSNPMINHNLINQELLEMEINLNDCKHQFVHTGNHQCRSADEAFTSFYSCTLCEKIITKN